MVVSVVALVLALCPALAADRTIKPAPPGQCRALAETLGKVAGIPLSVATGKPTFPNDVKGEACLLSGKAIGLAIGFDAMQDKLDRSLAGWTRVQDYDADGPYSTHKGFTRVRPRWSITSRPTRRPERARTSSSPTARFPAPNGIGPSKSSPSSSKLHSR
jgi:hypothetical protein